MLQPQSLVNPQFPSAESKRPCKFHVLAALELFPHRTGQLGTESILNKLLPSRFTYTQTCAWEVLQRLLDLFKVTFSEDRTERVTICEPRRRGRLARWCSNTANGAQI